MKILSSVIDSVVEVVKYKMCVDKDANVVYLDIRITLDNVNKRRCLFYILVF